MRATGRREFFGTGLLALLAEAFVRGVEGVLERHEVFARLERIEDGLLGFELLGRVGGGFHGQADAAVRLVNLNDARGHFLADFEHVLDLLGALFAHLGDVHQAVDIVLQADKGAEARELGHFAVTRSPTL